MGQLAVGDKLIAKSTHNNRENNIDPRDTIVVGFVEPAFVSIHVIKMSGSHRKLAVPIGFLWSNFEEDRNYTPRNPTYNMHKRAQEIFRG